VEVRFDDAFVASGRSDAILGHPLLALRATLLLAEEAGQPVREGTILLAGAATDPMVLRPGVRLQVCIEGLGDVGCSVAPD